MYEMLPYILSIIFILLGLFMVFMPKQSTKKELRDSEESVKKARRNGFIITVLGIVLLVINILL